jgi:hypothetical protein
MQEKQIEITRAAANYASTAYQAPSFGEAFGKQGIHNLTPERKEEMIAYAKKLREKHPHMTQARIMRKVAEYFKIKLT